MIIFSNFFFKSKPQSRFDTNEMRNKKNELLYKYLANLQTATKSTHSSSTFLYHPPTSSRFAAGTFSLPPWFNFNYLTNPFDSSISTSTDDYNIFNHETKQRPPINVPNCGNSTQLKYSYALPSRKVGLDSKIFVRHPQILFLILISKAHNWRIGCYH